MEIQVTSVARKDSTVAHTPAAVYVITSEDIRRSTATSIPELLRMVPGINVARINNSQWAVSARGFNNRFSNKLLVLMDGRSVYSSLYSGVYWEVQDTVLEDIERIEVIRGPGATIWGANAVNGVINIITRKASDTHGGLVVAAAGQHENVSVAARYGGRAGSNLDYRVWVKGFRRSSLPNERSQSSTDGWNADRGGFRADWTVSKTDTVTVQGSAYDSRTGETLAVDSLTGSRNTLPSAYSRTKGETLQASWRRARPDGGRAELSTSFDSWNRDEAIGSGHVNTWDLDYHAGRPVGGRQDVQWGLSTKLVHDRFTMTPGTSMQPPSKTTFVFGGFLQDEIALSKDRLWLTLGTKIEHNTYTGVELQPSAQLLWTPSATQSVWGSVARAVRTPSRAERDVRYDAGTVPLPGGLLAVTRVFGSPDFDSEVLIAHEGGYRIAPVRCLSLDAAVFYNRYSKLNALEAGMPTLDWTSSPPLVLPIYMRNTGRGEVHGAEISAHWSARPYWRLEAGSSLLRMDLGVVSGAAATSPRSDNGRSPRHQGQVASLLDLPHGFSVDLFAFAYGRLPTLDVPGYVRVDARLGWRSSSRFEASVAVENLTGREHLEFQPEMISRGHLMRRTVHGKIVWRF